MGPQTSHLIFNFPCLVLFIGPFKLQKSHLQNVFYFQCVCFHLGLNLDADAYDKKMKNNSDSRKIHVYTHLHKENLDLDSLGQVWHSMIPSTQVLFILLLHYLCCMASTTWSNLATKIPSINSAFKPVHWRKKWRRVETFSFRKLHPPHITYLLTLHCPTCSHMIMVNCQKS